MNALKLTLPSRWLDLTNSQLLFISRLYITEQSRIDFLVKSFLMLTGLKVYLPKSNVIEGQFWYKHSSMANPFILDSDLLSEVKEKCIFLLETGEVKPLHRIRMARPRHYRLYNASFEQYLMAENYYFAYTETRKEEHIDNLIACLYRKPWQKWDAEKIQRRSKYVKNVDFAVKNCVFLWYIGFRSYVPKRCKALFSSKGNSNGRPFNPREYINGMIHQLSNGDVTIKDKLLSIPCWDALDELEQRALEYQLLNEKK